MESIDVYVARPVTCPYLPERQERKILVPLADPGVYDELIQHGFRRSGRWAYRPRCAGCVACVPVRLDAAGFTPTRSQRRARNGFAKLARSVAPARATPELYELFARYLGSRHGDGAMAGMGEAEFAEMLEGTSVRTELLLYRDGDGALVAVMLLDVVADGVSLVYSFFAPERAGSPGVAMIVDAVAVARERRLPYVYLGYWVHGCRKMEYKADFSPLQVCGVSGWQPFEPPLPRG